METTKSCSLEKCGPSESLPGSKRPKKEALDVDTGDIGFYLKTCGELSETQKGEIFGIVKQNMVKLYKSNWGWNEKKKKTELFHSNSLYVLGIDSVSNSIRSFVHYRIVDENEDEEKEGQNTTHLTLEILSAQNWVLYVYEIQVAKARQRHGLGAKMMSLLEAETLAKGLNKMMLTVFKNNTKALRFYIDKLGYCIDDSSPSQCGCLDECYEILCKYIHRTRSRSSIAGTSVPATPTSEKNDEDNLNQLATTAASTSSVEDDNGGDESERTTGSSEKENRVRISAGGRPPRSKKGKGKKGRSLHAVGKKRQRPKSKTICKNRQQSQQHGPGLAAHKKEKKHPPPCGVTL